jgi:hypothetical protein
MFDDDEFGEDVVDDRTRDRAEIHDLFNRYADAVAGRKWKLFDEVFTEDVTSSWVGFPAIEGRAALVRRIQEVIEHSSETHLLGNFTATIDGDIAEASVRVRVYQMRARDSSRRDRKILSSFRARLIRTRKGWRFRHFGMGRSVVVRLPQV